MDSEDRVSIEHLIAETADSIKTQVFPRSAKPEHLLMESYKFPEEKQSELVERVVETAQIPYTGLQTDTEIQYRYSYSGIRSSTELLIGTQQRLGTQQPGIDMDPQEGHQAGTSIKSRQRRDGNMSSSIGSDSPRVMKSSVSEPILSEPSKSFFNEAPSILLSARRFTDSEVVGIFQTTTQQYSNRDDSVGMATLSEKEATLSSSSPYTISSWFSLSERPTENLERQVWSSESKPKGVSEYHLEAGQESNHGKRQLELSEEERKRLRLIKNRLSAERSRVRQRQRLEELVNRVHQLRQQNQKLRDDNRVLLQYVDSIRAYTRQQGLEVGPLPTAYLYYPTVESLESVTLQDIDSFEKS